MSAEAEAIFKQIDTDGSSSLDLPEMHAKLSDFGLGERQIEQIFFALDTNNDGEISLEEFVNGYDKFCNIRDGRAADFNSGPVQQWGFQKWKLDRWLAFDGKVISVYKCQGKPEPGVEPKYTIPMDVSVCFKDPTNDKRFSIDTGFSMVHFRTDKSETRDQWCDAFTAAQVDTAEARIDLIKTQKKYKEKISGTSGDYYLGDQLGEGGFAKVKAAIHAETGVRLAAKIMDAATAAEEEHKREIVAMAALKHKNLVGLHDVVYVPGKKKKKGTGHIYIMLEQCTGGELFSKVVDNGCLSEGEAMYYFRQILEGMMYCHSRKICHRDMKLENLLLDGTGKTCKITDFGFAKNLADDNASTVLGTAVYVAPEVLADKKYDGFKVDMWACGVVLYAMCVGNYPFDFGYHGGVGPEQKGQNAQLMKALMKADYQLPSDCSPGLTDLLSHLIQPDPEARYTAAQALKHPWCLGTDCPDAVPEASVRTAEDIENMQASMSTAYVETPEGDNPEVWLEKIQGAGVDQGAEAEPEAVDVEFDDDEEAGF